MTKTVLITGASSGFGAACAKKFGAAGWNLILLGRREERLEAVAQQSGTLSKVHVISVDITQQDPLKQSLDGIPSAFQHIDVLINNAGLALGLDGAHEADFNDWQTMINTNVLALAHCTRLILPRMVDMGQGHIINMGSIAGNDAYPGANVYGATKAFVKQFSRNLRADLHGTGIRVTNIEPGLAESEFSLVRFKGDRQKADDVYKNVKPLTPDDIAESVWWAVNQPDHVNVNTIELMPVCQTWGPLAVARET